MIVQKKIMIIDDDADDRMFFREALQEMLPPVLCWEADSCTDALEQLENAQSLPDFIFVDMNMPRLNGQECLKELKKNTRFRSIPIIMYSTSFTKTNIEELEALGASSYLHKPSDIKHLPDQIFEAISKSSKLF